MKLSRQAAKVAHIALTFVVLTAGSSSLSASPSVQSQGLRRPSAPPEPKPPSTVLSQQADTEKRPKVAEEAPASASAPPGQAAEGEQPEYEEGGRLSLICFGGGAANKPTVATAYGWGTFSGSYGSTPFQGNSNSTATVIGQRSQGFEDQIALDLQGEVGRVRMPRTMLPAIHGGDDGWFKLKNIKVKSNEITATVGVNFINSPKLRLDRYTGTVSISGKAGDFAGQCQRFDPATTSRKF